MIKLKEDANGVHPKTWAKELRLPDDFTAALLGVLGAT